MGKNLVQVRSKKLKLALPTRTFAKFAKLRKKTMKLMGTFWTV